MSIKSQHARRINEATLVVGVDIAKRSHVAVAEGPDGVVTKPLAFPNTQEGFRIFESWLRKTSERFRTTSMVIGMEPTGHYWKPFAEWLQQRSYELRFVSPVLTKRAKEMLDGSPLKTDAKDARVIADLLRQGKSRPMGTQEDLYQELRYLADVRHRLMVEKTALLNRLNRLLDLLFPELPSLFKRLDGITIRTLLKTAPTPEKVLELGVDRMTLLLFKASHGKLGRQRAEAIVEAASRSIACQYGVAALRFELELLLPRIEELLVQQTQVDHRMAERIKGIDYASNLQSIPGIGPVTVAIFLGEVGDLRNYRNAKQVLKMAGLNLFERSSGQQHGLRRMTKRGRPELRRILYMAAIRMVVKGMPLRGLHEKMSPTKPTPKVVVAGMRRLVKAMFAMVRDSRSFEQTLFEVRPSHSNVIPMAA